MRDVLHTIIIGWFAWTRSGVFRSEYSIQICLLQRQDSSWSDTTHHEWWSWHGLEFEFIKNEKFRLYLKRDIHNTWIIQAHVPTPTFSELIRELAYLAWKISIQNWHRANIGSPYFATHYLHLSCTSHSSRNLQSPSSHGMSNRWKSKLGKRTNE